MLSQPDRHEGPTQDWGPVLSSRLRCTRAGEQVARDVHLGTDSAPLTTLWIGALMFYGAEPVRARPQSARRGRSDARA